MEEIQIMAVTVERRFDFSGGIQSASTWIQRKANQIEDGYNIRFNKYIGAFTRRDGYIKEGNALTASTRTQGLHEAKFSNGAKVFAAQNNAGATATVIEYYQKSVGANWTNLPSTPAIDVNTVIQMTDSIGELYIAGKSTSTGNRVQIINVKNDLSVSTTRNLYGAPKSRFIVEYGGALYAINVDINGTVYADRAYRSSNALGAITFVQGYQAQTTATTTLKVDSVQYLKPGMTLDVYKAGTQTRTFANLSITSVDKNLKTITFTPQTTSSANASAIAASDQIVLTSTTNFPTGTPLAMTGGTLPTGLVAGTIYYAINIDATHLQLATTYQNALLGTVIDITAVGSGTATVTQGFGDNDEFWGAGRIGELAYYWNLDNPTTDQADFLRIIPGISSDSEITAHGKSNNRLFLFTKTATFKWDNANLVPVFEDIGCINQESIVNLNDWLIWVDAEGKIHARNDATGQHEVISRGIRNKWLENVTQAQFMTGSAGKSNNVFKICVGTVGGQIWQFNYDFDANTWTRDILTKTIANRLSSDMGGNMRAYFTDTAGQMWLDEEGNLDDTVTIPMLALLGRDNDGNELVKNYHGFYIFGINVSGSSVKLGMETNERNDLGQLTGSITRIKVPRDFKSTGRDYNLEITQNSEGDPLSIEGVSAFSSTEEDNFG